MDMILVELFPSVAVCKNGTRDLELFLLSWAQRRCFLTGELKPREVRCVLSM